MVVISKMTNERIRADSQTSCYIEDEKEESPNSRPEGPSFLGSEDAEGEPEYHLQVVDYTNGHLVEEPARRELFQTLIDSFLYGLFTAEKKDLAPGYACPLLYSNHVVETQISGVEKKILKILFKVSEKTKQNLNEALIEFCNIVFSKKGQKRLNFLTTADIFGLSPVPGTDFEQLWNSVFFLQMIKNGGQNLRWLLDSHRRSMIIPGWLSTSCFAFSSGAAFSFGAWAARKLAKNVGLVAIIGLGLVPLGMTTAGLFAAVSAFGELSRAVLEKKAIENTARAADAKFKATDWEEQFKKLIAKVDSVLRSLNEQHEQQSHSYTQDVKLGKKLLKVIELAAEMFTTNRQAFEIYDTMCKEYKIQFTSDVAVSAVYLGAAGIFAGLAQAAPMSIAEMGPLTTVFLRFVQAPLVTGATTSVLFTPAAPIAVAAFGAFVIWGAISIKSFLGKRKYDKKMECFVGVENLVCKIWNLAEDTHTLLSWIHCTNQAEPEFVSEEARIKWNTWIETVRQKSNAVPPSQDYSRQDLKNYLHERALDITRWKVEVNKLIKEFE